MSFVKVLAYIFAAAVAIIIISQFLGFVCGAVSHLTINQFIEGWRVVPSVPSVPPVP